MRLYFSLLLLLVGSSAALAQVDFEHYAASYLVGDVDATAPVNWIQDYESKNTALASDWVFPLDMAGFTRVAGEAGYWVWEELHLGSGDKGCLSKAGCSNSLKISWDASYATVFASNWWKTKHAGVTQLIYELKVTDAGSNDSPLNGSVSARFDNKLMEAEPVTGGWQVNIWNGNTLIASDLEADLEDAPLFISGDDNPAVAGGTYPLGHVFSTAAAVSYDENYWWVDRIMQFYAQVFVAD